MINDNLMSGFFGALVGGVFSIIGGWFAAKYTLDQQLRLNREQEQRDLDRVRRRFETYLTVARTMTRADDLQGAYPILKRLRDLMVDYAWLCDPEANQHLFNAYLLRLPEQMPSYSET